MQLSQRHPSLQKPRDPKLIRKDVIYIPLWAQIFTVAAVALVHTPSTVHEFHHMLRV